MKNLHFSLVVVAAISAATCFSASTLTLAQRGTPAGYTIVTPAQASEAERYAAEELQTFLAKVTGEKLPIATDAAPLPARTILLGSTTHTAAVLKEPAFNLKSLGDDGFRLVAKPPHLVVLGSPRRGILYGAYEILETYAGCRWYTSWHSRIPARDAVCVPATLNDTQKPAFAMRQPFWYDYIQNLDFGARLRVNGYNHTGRTVPAKFGGDDFRFGGGLSSSHTFNTLVPPSEFFATHPEYFSFENGRRINGRTQLCLTNPDVLRIVTERVLARIRKDPTAKFYGVSQNDWYHFCQCEKCKAIDEEEESHAGTMVRFVNAVAERVEKEFPNVIIETLAYQYTRKPPKKTRLRHNVVPCLCTIECDFARPIPQSPYQQNIDFLRDIAGWKTQTDQLYVWDYTTDFHHYCFPMANVYTLQDNLKFFRDNNVKEIFEQGAYQGRHGDFAELKGWLLAKLMWNPDQPLEPLLADFFDGYYGKGAPFVRAYCEELHKRQRAWSAVPTQPLRENVDISHGSLSNEFLDWASAQYARAIAATKDDPATSYNVRMSAFAVDYTRLERLRRSYTKLLWLKETPPDFSDFHKQQDLARKLLATFREAKTIRLSENINLHNATLQAWQKLVNAPKPTTRISPRAGELEEADLPLFNKGTWGTFVDDPKAADGKALKLFNTHYEWCTQLHLDRIGYEPGQTYRVRIRVRVEKQGAGMAFSTGIYDFAKRQSVTSKALTTEKTTADYAWYEVGSVVLNDNQVLWIAPGRFDDQGASAIKAVYIDKVDFARVAP